MLWFEEHWLRLVFVAAYLALMVHHCLRGRPADERSKDENQNEETSSVGKFLTGGGMLGGWTIALSFYATFVSQIPLSAMLERAGT